MLNAFPFFITSDVQYDQLGHYDELLLINSLIGEQGKEYSIKVAK
jgi:hypothetical protein